MKRPLRRLLPTAILFALAGTAQAAAPTDLLISEYVEGSSNNKALEFYNGTGAPIDLAVGGYNVQFFFNGSGAAGLTINLTGTVASGDVFVLAQASAAAAILAQADQTNGAGWFNGDDAIVLRKGTTVIDSVGDVGFDPGTEWGSGLQSTADNSIRRKATVCTGDTNAGDDFVPSVEWDGFAVDTFGGLGAHTAECGGIEPTTPTLGIDNVTGTEGDSGTTSFTFTISLNAPAGPGGVTFDIATANDAANSGEDYIQNVLTGQTIPAGLSTYAVNVTVSGDETVEGDETFFVNVTNAAGATVADGQGLGTITNDDFRITPIGEIQGNDLASPLLGQMVATEGVVTALRFNNGFFLQSFETAVDQLVIGGPEPDGDPATSDGIFVFTGSAPTVAVGDHVRVRATVAEYFGGDTPNLLPVTQLGSPQVIPVESGIALPEPVELTAAELDPAGLPGALERYEGMRVSIASSKAVAPSDGSINEANATSTGTGAFYVVLPGAERPHREKGMGILDAMQDALPPGVDPPDFDNNPEKLAVYGGQVGPRIPLVDVGATVNGLVGVLDYFGADYELLYDSGIEPNAPLPEVVGGMAATAVADPGPNDITVGGFNLLRFFDTVNDPSIGEPVLTGTAFANRLAKTGAAICDWVKAPDILGVVEVENLATLTELANYINGNCASAPAYAPYLLEGNDVGGIDVGFLVSNRLVNGVARVAVASVTQIGKDTEYGKSPIGCTPGAQGCDADPLNDRPSLMLRATVNFADGRDYPLTVIVNHLRSLGGNDDPADGRVRYKRAEQALQLAGFVNGLQTADPNEKIVLVGDFNAFAFNDGYVDPMGIITGNAAPSEEVVEHRASPVATPLVLGEELIADTAQRYSYVFGGNAQTLDHAVVNEALVNDPGVTDLIVEHARINADFSVAHYGQFVPPYDSQTPPLRVSDHDPVRLTIAIKPDTTPPALAPVLPGLILQGGTYVVAPNATDENGIASASCTPTPLDTSGPGPKTVTCTATDLAGNTASVTLGYTVTSAQFQWQQPLLPVVYSVNANQRVLLQWRLVNTQGGWVDSLQGATVTSTPIACPSPFAIALPPYTANAIELQNMGTGMYRKTWQVAAGQTGTCLRMNLDVGDGKPHTVLFKLK